MINPVEEWAQLPGMGQVQELTMQVRFTPDQRRFRVTILRVDFTGKAQVVRAWPWADASASVLAYRLEKYRSRVEEELTPF